MENKIKIYKYVFDIWMYLPLYCLNQLQIQVRSIVEIQNAENMSTYLKIEESNKKAPVNCKKYI